VRARGNATVDPNYVYIIPPNTMFTLEGAKLRVKNAPDRHDIS
jgi:hypothetical protein